MGMDLYCGLLELFFSVLDFLRFWVFGDEFVNLSEFGDVGWLRVEVEVIERVFFELRFCGE